uniref:PID domain-containing protein n=1 Tax=Arion vulgaris TaxID=1028688 RepID=A0A0B7A3N6_9EUPU
MAARFKRAFSDPTRFEGNGISYKAKLIGIEDVKEARGDLMCQDALIKLKNYVKISGEHKRKIFVNVTLEGLKIIDAISLASNHNKKKSEPKSPKLGERHEEAVQGQDLIVLHTHAVHRISFISRDATDNRAFGYVFGTEDGLHKFFAIKTAAAAEHLVLTLRDLFQVVYEMKKKEMDAAKEKLDKGELTTVAVKENLQPSGTGSTSGIAQTPAQKVNAEPENIYQNSPFGDAFVGSPQQVASRSLFD